MTVSIVTADNAEVKTMVKLRRMLALSPTFKTVVPNYGKRLERVWVEGSPDEALATMENTIFSTDDLPFAFLWPVSCEYTFTGGGLQNHVLPGGSIHVYLRMPRAKGMDWNDARLDGLRFLGNWMRDVTSLFGKDDSEEEGTPAVAGEGHFAATRAIALEPQHVQVELRGSMGDFFFRSWSISGGDGDGGGQ